MHNDSYQYQNIQIRQARLETTEIEEKKKNEKKKMGGRKEKGQYAKKGKGNEIV